MSEKKQENDCGCSAEGLESSKLGDIAQGCCSCSTLMQRLWQLRAPSNCCVCISSILYTTPPSKLFKTQIFQGVTRYAIGEGQVRALPYIISSLTEAYGRSFKWNRLIHANAPEAERIIDEDECDVILVGGPFTNPASREAFLQLSTRLNISRFDNSGVTFTIESLKNEFSYNVQGDFKCSLPDVRADIGIIVSYSVALAPQERARRIVIFAGCNTYGTAAAAQFFCTRLTNTLEWQENWEQDYVAIVEGRYVQHPPVQVGISLKGFHCF